VRTTWPELLRGVDWPGLKPATSRLQVQRPNHYATAQHVTTVISDGKLLENEWSNQKNGLTGPVTLKICTGSIWSGPGPLDGAVKIKNADNTVTGHYTAPPTSP